MGLKEVMPSSLGLKRILSKLIDAHRKGLRDAEATMPISIPCIRNWTKKIVRVSPTCCGKPIAENCYRPQSI